VQRTPGRDSGRTLDPTSPTTAHLTTIAGSRHKYVARGNVTTSHVPALEEEMHVKKQIFTRPQSATEGQNRKISGRRVLLRVPGVLVDSDTYDATLSHVATTT
jgi:hypothetical protein